jgi:lysyl-tRNA synthetase class 2
VRWRGRSKPITTRSTWISLRIAPEYPKRLTVGGWRKSRNQSQFQERGISTQHNPEFTMMEFYEAYADYQALMTMTEELV